MRVNAITHPPLRASVGVAQLTAVCRHHLGYRFFFINMVCPIYTEYTIHTGTKFANENYKGVDDNRADFRLVPRGQQGVAHV